MMSEPEKQRVRELLMAQYWADEAHDRLTRLIPPHRGEIIRRGVGAFELQEDHPPGTVDERRGYRWQVSEPDGRFRLVLRGGRFSLTLPYVVQGII